MFLNSLLFGVGCGLLFVGMFFAVWVFVDLVKLWREENAFYNRLEKLIDGAIAQLEDEP